MKKISRRSFLAAAAVSVAALAMTACGGSASSAASSVASSAASSEAASSAAAAELTTVEAGKLTMATNAAFPPYEMTTDAGEFEGIDVDTAIPGDLATDTGIALANMTLAAWDKGVGSCIMGAINKPALTELLGIEEPQKLAFMVAFGYPTHKASIVPMTEQTGVKYYLDENRDYCVPKRSAEELARSL